MKNMTLTQAAEKARQAEIICLLIESYPHRFVDSEITAISSLLAKLTGNVAAFLIEAQAEQENRTTIEQGVVNEK
ncbi:hypothetical protein [Pragia fontium]|uniref:hypothetical protein n=1 Tax=Pragia fontium TaxID=82985 RepID=UPI00064AE1FC|nr:hypothetical protein [Pragia fontium]AKJ41528.1 hypothetical protein QQ39_05060 [Pragia fontium]